MSCFSFSPSASGFPNHASNLFKLHTLGMRSSSWRRVIFRRRYLLSKIILRKFLWGSVFSVLVKKVDLWWWPFLQLRRGPMELPGELFSPGKQELRRLGRISRNVSLIILAARQSKPIEKGPLSPLARSLYVTYLCEGPLAWPQPRR